MGYLISPIYGKFEDDEADAKGWPISYNPKPVVEMCLY
jgi:hypothetical protein